MNSRELPARNCLTDEFLELGALFHDLVRDIEAAAAEGLIGDVIDIEHDMDVALDEWVQATDEVGFTLGYPHHTVEVREGLIAFYHALALDEESTFEEISDELRTRILAGLHS